MDTCSFTSFNRPSLGVCPKHRNPSYVSCWLNPLSMEEHPLLVMLLPLGTGVPAPGVWELWLLLHTEFLHHVLGVSKWDSSGFAATEGEFNHGQPWQTRPATGSEEQTHRKMRLCLSLKQFPIMPYWPPPGHAVSSPSRRRKAQWPSQSWGQDRINEHGRHLLLIQTVRKLHNCPAKGERTNFFICPDILFYHFMW